MDEAVFEEQFSTFQRQSLQDGRWQPRREDFRKVLDEDTPNQTYDSHYMMHTGWAARILAGTRPEKHVDISSSMYFVTIASAFVPIDFYDYRETRIPLPGLNCKGKADLLALPFEDNSIQSLSCMHVIEHLGLGRYGDPINPGADKLAAAELTRVLAPGGQLIMAMPCGWPRVMFNAHRIYAWRQARDLFAALHLREFCFVPTPWKDGGAQLIRDASPALVHEERHECGGCGCFWYVKERR